MQTNMQTISNTPWYRQFWPWLLLFFPAIALVGGLFTFWLAAHSADPLVVDDYYQQGKFINQSLARTQMASTLQLSAELEFPDALNSKNTNQDISLHLHSAQNLPMPDQLVLRVIHPTQAGRDQTLYFHHKGKGNYRAALTHNHLGSTRWQLQLENAQRTWHLRQTTRVVPTQKIVMTP